MFGSIGTRLKKVSSPLFRDAMQGANAMPSGGLLGSQAVAQDFKARGVPIKAQIQYDMTAWVKKGTKEEVGVITDFVDPR